MEIFRLVDIVLPEQVIDVPKISPDRIAQRFVDRDTQRVEQLVEVPTVVSPTFLLQLAEQNVDIPVLGHGVYGYGGLQGSHPGQSSFQPTLEPIVEIPVPGGALQDFRPDQGSVASSAFLLEEPFQRVLRTFPRGEECEGHLAVECESARALQLIRAERSSNGSCPRCS